jgi:hypothetical protein
LDSPIWSRGRSSTIRHQIYHTLEGNHLHDLAVFLAERLLSERKNPAVRLWGPQARDDFRAHTDFPGLPDIVFTHDHHTYVIEMETHPSKRMFSKKLQQFWRCGITDVIVVPLNLFKNVNNWKSLETQIEDWLP